MKEFVGIIQPVTQLRIAIICILSFFHFDNFLLMLIYCADIDLPRLRAQTVPGQLKNLETQPQKNSVLVSDGSH